MSEAKKDQRGFEIRFYLKDEFAKALRKGESHPGLTPLNDVLVKHNVGLHNQWDQSVKTLKEMQQVRNWDQSTMSEQEKKWGWDMEVYILDRITSDCDERGRGWVPSDYLRREFTIERADHGMYKGNEADQLIADLQSLYEAPDSVFGEGPHDRDRGVRKLYRGIHPGTTVPAPGQGK
jgi:hypothetical protein